MEYSIFGTIEQVSLPSQGVGEVLAKIDTGAYSGALHCTDIKVYRKVKSGKRILRYNALGKAELRQATDNFMETYIRSVTGHRVKRYVIDTTIVVKGKEYPIRIGLADRSKMKFPVLLGRRFLRENNMLVDVRINEEYDDEGESTR